MDFYSLNKSPYVVVKALRALEALNNALVSIQVLLQYGSLILDMTLGCCFIMTFGPDPWGQWQRKDEGYSVQRHYKCNLNVLQSDP